MYETIDLLQQTTDYYYIDYIPYNTDDPNFLELEEYFEKHYLSSFSEKITKIILKIIYYYPCKVYLTEPTKDIPINSTLDFYSNIRHYSPSLFPLIPYIVTEKSPHILIRNFGVENNIWSDEKSVNITFFIILENSEGE